MSLLDLYSREIVTLALVTSRMAGLVLTSPFPGEHVPARVKVAMIFVFGWLATSTIAPVGSPFDFALIGVAGVELGIGLLIGMTVRFTFSIAEVIGANVAQSVGLSMAHVFDPTLGSEDSVASRYITLLGMLLFFGVGAHRVLLAYVFESFHAVPVGHAVSFAAALPLLVDQAADALLAGVHLALPVIVVGLVIQLTLAFVARASPQLQVFSVGASVGLAGGVLVTMAAMPDIATGLSTELAGIGPHIESLLGAIQSQ